MRKCLLPTIALGVLLLSAAFVASPAVAQPPKAGRPEAAGRKKWEYKILNGYALLKLVSEDNEGKKVVAKLLKGEGADAGPPDDGPIVVFALNKLGDDGWELVTCPQPNGRTWIIGAKDGAWVFKRPR
jgi:hypothetical protein